MARYYAKAPVGNSPELMPWDCSLNKDLMDALAWHCLLTSHLEEDDDWKFSITTPKRGAESLKKVIQAGNPNGTRIGIDVFKVFGALETIVKHKGIVVPGLGDRKGRRHQKAIDGVWDDVRNWGGRRYKDPESGTYQSNVYLHDDAKLAGGEKVDISRERHAMELTGEVSFPLILPVFFGLHSSSFGVVAFTGFR